MYPREDIKMRLGLADVCAFLGVPENPKGLVIFAHGSGSSRHSSRNQYVAEVLHKAGLATLLVDLLTQQEAADRSNVFDIDLLADRVLLATNWAQSDTRLRDLPVGYFGASTGAAAALRAAAARPKETRAVVSRGGRPDLAGEALRRVRAPTLLVVGGHDYDVIRLNQMAFEALKTSKDLTIVPRATHLFEEPGALEEAADLARDWMLRYLGRPLQNRYYEEAHTPL